MRPSRRKTAQMQAHLRGRGQETGIGIINELSLLSFDFREITYPQKKNAPQKESVFLISYSTCLSR
jgi:hypothetical protein